MKTALRRFYDNHTRLALAFALLTGLFTGGLLAYEPLPTGSESAAGPATRPTTSPVPQATTASISIPTPAGPAPEASPADPGEPLEVQVLHRDAAGYVSAPYASAAGDILLTTTDGRLLALDSTGAVRWETALPATPVGEILHTGSGGLAVVDRSGRLAVYTEEGDLQWEFLPENGSGVSAAAQDAAGNFYYMLEITGGGWLQSVGPNGETRWRSPVEGRSFRTRPWSHPAESLVFVNSVAFDGETGAPVPVELPFEVDGWLTSSDGQAFLVNGPTVAAWSLLDNAVILPEEGLRFVLPEATADLRQASLNPGGLSWIAYIGESADGIAWFNADGTLANHITSNTTLLTHFLSAGENRTVYACGLSPRRVNPGEVGQRATECLAYTAGSTEPGWKLRLGAAPRDFTGAVWLGGEAFFAAREGELYVLGRSAAAVNPEQGETAAATVLENGWFWPAPARILNVPYPLSDGTLPIFLETGAVHFLNPDGTKAGELILPEFGEEDLAHNIPVDFSEGQIAVSILEDRVYAAQAGAGQIWEFPVELNLQAEVLPHYISGDLHLLMDQNQVFYAYTASEGLLWQTTLDAPLRDEFSFPATDGEGKAYIADAAGSVYAFDASGLLWTYTAETGRRTTTDVVIGPDGNLYFVTAAFSNGFLVSLTPEGQERWVAELETFRFTNEPEFSATGEFVRVAESFVETKTGVVRPVEFPFEVTDFIEGEDGRDYLLTGSHLIQWELGPDGYQEIRDTTVNLGETSRFFRPFAQVYASGLVEFEVFRQNSITLIWVDPVSGETRSFERPWSQILLSSGTGEPEHIYCDQDLEAGLLSCKKFVPGSAETVWQLEIEGIEGGVAGFPPAAYYLDGRLHLIAGGQILYVFEVEIP